MRKVVISEFVSLDGVMEDPGGAEGYAHGGWTFRHPDPDGMKYKLDEVMAADAMLLGRVTYEGFAAAWPGMTDDVGFADKMNAMPKYVVSTTLASADWNNSTLIAADVADAVRDLKDQPGQEILVAGSRTLAQTLLADGLVDEYRLMIFPVILGSGKRLFGETTQPATMTLVDSKQLASGTMILTYHPAPAATGGAGRG
ncbi:MAG TPA: dihydrofolate reductase family protein [Solirubrobacteraceae bacterium]|jgi:dihydrofolate reductase|nr:dihydrofolate reductase family protein [Solirubrobacteraceae bacterium]